MAFIIRMKNDQIGLYAQGVQIIYPFFQVMEKFRVKPLKIPGYFNCISTALGVGLALVPIKEASVPNKAVDQNQAAAIRTSIKRLEYMVQDNQLIGDKDLDIVKKNNKLKDELKQAQIQLIDVPIDITNNLSEEELNDYFNSPKVNKKYRLKAR